MRDLVFVSNLGTSGNIVWIGFLVKGGAEFACKLVGFIEDEHLKVAFEKAPQNFYADKVLVADGMCTDMIQSASGDFFLDDVQF